MSEIDAWLSEAVEHHRQKRYPAAEAMYRRVISADPKNAQAISLFSVLALEIGQLDAAERLIHQALQLSPDDAVMLNNLGVILEKRGDFVGAVSLYEQAIARQPDYLRPITNLGDLLRRSDRTDEAMRLLNGAAEMPGPPDARAALLATLSALFIDEGDLDAAEKHLRQAIDIHPDSALAHSNLSFVLLSRGEFKDGWAEMEWRFGRADFPNPPPVLPQPRLSSIESGKTILIRCEQGFGDTIQFIRYVPLLLERGARVIVECPAELKSLLAESIPAVRFVARGEEIGPFDAWSPLLSMPRVFGTELANVPAGVPYLRVDPARSKSWGDRLRQIDSRKKIGLAWTGDPLNAINRRRSIPLAQMAALGQVDDVTFISLQKVFGLDEAKNPPPGLRLIDVESEIHDFADTAAVMENLDLVISIDSSSAHLAGALARPTWLLLSQPADWRWLRDREDSPWYPRMRLFRQNALGDWTGAIQKVVTELRQARFP